MKLFQTAAKCACSVLAWGATASSAWALSCEEVLILVDAKVPSSTIVAALHSSETPTYQDDVDCLARRGVDVRIVAEAQSRIPKPKEKVPEEESTGPDDSDAGSLGAWDDLSASSGATGTGLDGLEGPIGIEFGIVGDAQGGYGSSDRGGGGGGGGSSVDGVGMGTHGRGSGASGYGEGGGESGKHTGSLKPWGGDAIILGALDKSFIDKVIKQSQAKFLYCYQRELVKNPNLQGRVTLKFTISGDGSVASSRTHKTTLKNSKAESCMNQQIKMLKFPEPKGGGIVIVKYPFEFSAG